MSLTRDQREIIDKEVAIWMNSERMFTAFEISRAVKAKGVELRHREMKEFIHASIYRKRSRTYTRTLLDVGAPQQAWVYHPMSKNPHTFEPIQRTASGLNSDSTDHSSEISNESTVDSSADSSGFHSRNLSPLANGSAPIGDIGNGVYGCDRNGNLCLPAHELSQLGIGPHTLVYIHSHPNDNSLSISSVLDSDGQADSETTSATGSLLITHEMLEFVDLDWLASYKVELMDDGVLRVCAS